MSNDTSTSNSNNDGQSTYDRKQQAGKKKGTTYESFKDGKSQGIDYGVKDSVENYKESKFKEGKNPNIKGSLSVLNSFFKKGSGVTRTYYTEKVLKGKDLEKFRSLNTTEQEKQYKGYLDRRLSGETDAMGNVNPNFGRDGNNSVKTEKQVDKESEEEMETTTTPEDEEAYKKRKGLKGSRSLFSTGGQRGFFN
tara:strand:+ start:137 stop:718 length:582 start_codon:yes stop_codon:yes gene_type:complete